jgi:hypothetical protein
VVNHQVAKAVRQKRTLLLVAVFVSMGTFGVISALKNGHTKEAIIHIVVFFVLAPLASFFLSLSSFKRLDNARRTNFQ